MAVPRKDDIQNLVITQSNQLIEATYPPALTARAHKVARLVLSLIKPEDKDLKLYTVKIDFLKRFLGFSGDVTWGRFIDDIKDIFDRLKRERIEIRQEHKITIATFLAGVELDTKHGTVTFEVSSLLKPYLIELRKNFTSFLLSNIPKLRSAYSIRLYELLSQYRKIGWRTIPLDELQRKVGSNYTLYGDFKRKVLHIAQRDLAELTDIRFEYDELKEVRRIAAIKFYIYPNKPKEKDNDPLLLDLFANVEVKDRQAAVPPLSGEIIGAIAALGISPAALQKLLTKGFDIVADPQKRKEAEDRCQTLDNYFIEKLTLTEQSKKVIEHGNSAGFFIEALKNNWLSSQLKRDATEKKTPRKNMDERSRLLEMERRHDHFFKEYKQALGPIYEELTTDAAIFKAAYEAALEQVGEARNRYVGSVLTPIEQYHESPAFAASVHIQLKKQFVERFEDVEKRLGEPLKKLAADIAALKKQAG